MMNLENDAKLQEALSSIGAEFERRRSIRKRQLVRAALAGFAACVIFPIAR